MRSKCRSLFLSLSLLSATFAMQIGAPPRFSCNYLFLEQAQAKEAGTSSDNSSQETAGAKCSPGASGASAGGPGGGAGGGPGAPRARRDASFAGEGGMAHMPLDLSSLSLSDDQKDKIKAIRGRSVARAKELRQKLMTKGNEFRDLLYSETATNDQITAKRDEMKPIKEELESLRLNDFLAIRAVFTGDQRKKFAESKPEHKLHLRGGQGAGEVDTDKADKSTPTTTAKLK